jgi:hypothetical protein
MHHVEITTKKIDEPIHNLIHNHQIFATPKLTKDCEDLNKYQTHKMSITKSDHMTHIMGHNKKVDLEATMKHLNTIRQHQAIATLRCQLTTEIMI